MLEFTISNDDTARQAQFLDKRRKEAACEEGGRDDDVESVKTVKTQLNGCWVDLRVDVSSLRAALGLPLHDLLHDFTFRDHAHNETTGPDVEDTDHGVVQLPPQLTATLSSLSTSTQSMPANNNDSDSKTKLDLEAA